MDDGVRRAPERLAHRRSAPRRPLWRAGEAHVLSRVASTYPEQWVALAEGPSGDPGEVGQGETPQQALLHLARILEPIRGSASG